MFRFVSTYSRTVLLSNNLLLRSTRSFANQQKTAQVRSADDNSKTRRNPVLNSRRLNVKKLFSDEDAIETINPTDPRRPTIAHSSRFEDPTRLASNLPTQTRYENDIATVNDFENEERQRRINRQNKVKLSDIEQQSKRKISQKKFTQNTDVQSSDFDGSDYIATNKKNDRKFKSKKDHSLTSSQTDSSVASEGSNQSPTPSLYSSKIQSVNSIEDLLKIFDNYVIPTEFALGLQKLSQLASDENNDAIQSYTQLENNRQRLESLLISFINRFSDHEILTAITFVSKYYPEDNDFTEKFSLSLSARLRRINVHQIVRILEELKSSRHTAQWIHRVYNRLLSLAEGRYFEFDNIRDILALTHKISYNDRLIQRLDERILELTDNLTFDDWLKILINKSMLKRRDRTIIRAACYHLLKLSESFVFPLDKIKDCLLACSMLSIHEKNILERLIRDAFEQVKQINEPFILQSIVTSMGTLRLRHCELLDAFGRVIFEDINKFQTSIPAFIRTCAAVNYSPIILTKIIENHFQLDDFPLNDIKNRIDLVWSLAILDQANQNHVQSVLNQDIFQLIQNEVSNSKIASALKLLAIYSYSLQKFSIKFLKPTFNVEQLAQQLTLKNSNAQDQLAKTITVFAAENQYSKFSVVTSNMIVLDCLMIVDKNGTPQDLNTVLTNGDSNSSNGQTTFNKVRIDQNRFKVAIKCLDYQDKTLLTNSVSGSIALQLRLLNSLGYKCVPIHYDEFMKIQVPNDRVKYVQRKINEAINPSTTLNNK